MKRCLLLAMIMMIGSAYPVSATTYYTQTTRCGNNYNVKVYDETTFNELEFAKLQFGQRFKDMPSNIPEPKPVERSIKGYSKQALKWFLEQNNCPNCIE